MSIIHLIAPSGYCLNQQAAIRGVARLVAAGFQVNNQSVITRRYQRFAGSDTQRLQDINQLARLPAGTELVLAIRGGYGASRLLAQIDYQALAQRQRLVPLLLCGHSDFTAIQLALLACSKMITFSGPMLAANFGADELDTFTWQHFCQALTCDEFNLHWQSEAAPCQVQGTLWGGNLAILTSLIGTRWLPAIHGGILLLEDINEPLFRIERMLWQLFYAGILTQQRAIILGDFSYSDVRDYDAGYNWQTLLQLLHSLVNIPIIDGLKFGHRPQTVTIPSGAHGILQHDGHKASLTIRGHHTLKHSQLRESIK